MRWGQTVAGKIDALKLTTVAPAAVVAAVLNGCTASPQRPVPQPSSDTSSQRKFDLVPKLQNQWGRCLNISYSITVKHTPDKNAAAEEALRACATEEQHLATQLLVGKPWASDSIVSVKAAMKRTLIGQGRISDVRER